MQLRVIALDFDGTITDGDSVHADVRESIAHARRRGLKVLLATGRRVAHLRESAGDLTFVDGIVAENGAVLTIPSSGESMALARPPSELLLGELGRRGVEYQVGEVIVECDASRGHDVLGIIRENQLPLVLLFNRDRLMILPQGISKATGLRHLLSTMRLSLHNTVSVGDAENDHELLAAAELGLAVRWGSPTLIAAADDVIEGGNASSVAAWIRSVCESSRIPTKLLNRRKLLLGSDEATASPVYLAIKRRNVVIVGDPRSGKSWIAGLLAEQLIMQRYSICVIDPEGDYEGLESLPDVIRFGGDDPPPRARELTRALRHSDVSILVNLSKMPLDAKRRYVRELLQMLIVLRRTTGLPHRIFLDEAHYFLDQRDDTLLVDLDLAGYTLVSYRASDLDRALISATEAVIVSRETGEQNVRWLLEAHGITTPLEEWLSLLGGLQTDEAVVFPGIDETGALPVRVKLAPRSTYHVRHLQKYVDVPIAEHHAFVFTNGMQGRKAKTLGQFAEVLSKLPPSAVEGHLERNDFSRWIGQVYGDHALASRIRECEERHRIQRLPDVNGAIAAAIRERYLEPEGV